MSERDPKASAQPTLRDTSVPTRAAARGSRLREPSASPALREGQRFGGYLIRHSLGRGGFAEVWEALHEESGRQVALKVLARLLEDSTDAEARFRQEGRLAASLSHRRCVYVMGAEAIEGRPTITMELMPGGTLQDLLDSEGPLPYTRAVDLVLDVIEGLDAAARRGIVHRDVKPSNCFLDADGRARIGDFGIAKGLELDARLTATGLFLGTPAYASPEQVRGLAVDDRSDMYSVGATLYALLSGRPPFEGTSAGDLIARITGERPAPLPRGDSHVPGPLRRIVQRLLEKDPDRRYASYGALRQALRPFGTRATGPARTRDRVEAAVGDAGLVIATFALLAPWLGPGPWTMSLLFGLEAAWILGPLARTGRTIGDRAKHLSVVGSSGLGAGVWGALRRGLTLLIPHQAALLGAVWTQGADGWLLSFGLVVWPLLVTLPLPGRRGITLLDGLTATRLVVLPNLAPEAPPISVPWRASAAEAAPTVREERLGPYRILRTLWSRGAESLREGMDDALQRRAWLHVRPAESPGPAPARPALDRSARLRWLAGSVGPGQAWDAHEAPSGMSLTRFVRERGRLPWDEARQLLLHLVEELQAGLEAGDLPTGLSLEHLWVDASGQLKVLEVPVRQVDEPSPDPPHHAWPPVLRRTVLACLEGEVPAARALPRLPLVPLPEHVRPFLEHVGSESPDLAWLATELRGSAGRPARVTSLMRSKAIVLRSLPSLGFISFLALILALEPHLRGDLESSAGAVAAAAYFPLLLLSLPCVLLAWVTPGGPLLRDSGIAVQLVDGRPASRSRCLWRASVAWSPTLVAVLWILGGLTAPSAFSGTLPGFVAGFSGVSAADVAESFRDGRDGRSGPPDAGAASPPEVGSTAGLDHEQSDATLPDLVFTLLLLAQAAGAVHALLHPERSLADRIAGTILVPR